MKLEFPLRLGRGQNDRKHWRATYRKRKEEKDAIAWLLRGCGRPAKPCTFILTRIAPSSGLDDDNLAGSWKAGRDAIAEWIGVDDKKRDLVRYEYKNERGSWGIRIESRPL